MNHKSMEKQNRPKKKVEVGGNKEILSVVTDGVVFDKAVFQSTQSASGLADVEEATPGAPDAIDYPNRLTSEVLPHLEGLFGTLNDGVPGGVVVSTTLYRTSYLGSISAAACKEFVHFPRDHADFLWVLRFPPTIQRHNNWKSSTAQHQSKSKQSASVNVMLECCEKCPKTSLRHAHTIETCLKLAPKLQPPTQRNITPLAILDAGKFETLDFFLMMLMCDGRFNSDVGSSEGYICARK
ncbi:uncharacterized protein LOC132404316 [Hypanus sabinus]|uniref:uncharacterized protein LOC132404316 n=1 Tax=Hypanus sabinus TaxID=79690 RepID=UPI0028C4F74B|nr:uncharacterized protein LOC132404316 [Hypanus sabinus]